MNILVASDSYKGSLTSNQALAAVKEVAEQLGGIQVSGLPIADGGEGTLEAIFHVLDGERVTCTVTDPIGRKIPAFYGLFGKTAVVEMAISSGLTLLKEEERNPYIATSYGLGELIAHALDNSSIEEVIVAIGGSATNDGGLGMAQALGLSALDKHGRDVAPGGGSLKDIVKIDCRKMHPRLKEVRIRAMCDVNNPLCGTNGASAVYGSQKGASSEMVANLDDNLRHLSQVIRRDVGIDVLDLPGAGAAGGAGAGLIAFCDAELEPGIDVMLDLAKFEDMVKRADLILTGEGQTDYQTAFGKVVSGVAKRSKPFGKPLICLSGALGANYQNLYDLGVDAFFSICPGPVTERDAMTNVYRYFKDSAENILRFYLKGRGK